MIAALFATSRHVRRHAFDRLPMSDVAAFAARDVVLFDADASVRARAAFFLAKAPPAIAMPSLLDALEDEMPLVRHAASRALASLGDASSIERIASAATQDPIWWVRRAAIVTIAALAPHGRSTCVAALREALDDPFWRVRNAAVRALLTLDEDPTTLVEHLGPPTTARDAGALSYLARRLGVASSLREKNDALDVPNAIVARLDPDPAIVTARLDRGDAVTSAFLVECLGDPHEALRATARKRLARTHDLRAFELALLWLDEPRIPHAAQTVVALLDRLDATDVAAVLDIAFERGGHGAVCWAASYVGLTRDASRRAELLSRVDASDAMVRCAVIAALGQLGDDASVDAVIAALGDSDSRVVRTAVAALLEHCGASASAMAALAAFECPRDVNVRRLLARAAVERSDVNALVAAARDADARVSAMATSALASMNALDSSTRAACQTSSDPWMRIAVMTLDGAARALETDPHPTVRREAFRILARSDAHRAALLASREDSWLQTRACALLDVRIEEHLVALLRLARDKSVAVRAAAADALERRDIDAALDALVASPKWRSDADAEMRIAAYAHRARHFEQADLDRLALAHASESPAVRAWIDDARGVALTEEIARPTVNGRSASAVDGRGAHELIDAPRRSLGATGIQISALAISGAGMLPTRAYADAMHAGCNFFFWEPRYHTLGRMLAREPSAGVIAGTYEATERAIVSDVERSLRRLRRETLDVFLLFWARSPARTDAPLFDILDKLKAQGKIRAFGFSTHDRDLACDALASEKRWDVIMTRHSAVHPGAEDRVLPLACETNTAILGFSALSYGRILSDAISAPDAYAYSLSQPGVSACLSAPRSASELEQNLMVLRASALPRERQDDLRARGKIVHAASRDFARSIRRHPIGLAEWLDQEDVVHIHHE